MKVGYIRVSTVNQHLDRQLDSMNQVGVEEIFEEKVSGKNVTDRPKFKEALDFVRKGDTFYVVSLDRLGRDYEDIKATVQYLKDKGVRINILDAPFLNFDTGNDLLDKAMFDMFLSLLSYISQNEREKILERQAEGIKAAKKRGAYKGKVRQYSPTSKDPKHRAIYNQIVNDLQNEKPIAQIAIEAGVTRPTVYKIRKELLSQKESSLSPDSITSVKG